MCSPYVYGYMEFILVYKIIKIKSVHYKNIFIALIITFSVKWNRNIYKETKQITSYKLQTYYFWWRSQSSTPSRTWWISETKGNILTEVTTPQGWGAYHHSTWIMH
jgi:hypothetical protein